MSHRILRITDPHRPPAQSTFPQKQPARTPLGMLLDEHMRQERISQERLASRLYVSQSALSNWRLGKRKPKESTCRRIAAVTGIPVTRILRAVAEGGE